MRTPDSEDEGPLAQINVTPLVDVMLVLLIIFMVTASLGQQGITVNLPQASAKPMEVTEDLVTVSVDASRHIYINREEVGFADLGNRLKAIYGLRTNKALFIKADQGLAYGDFARIVAVIKASGVVQLGMITEAPAP
jgi:biopolymer transport protein TolR